MSPVYIQGVEQVVIHAPKHQDTGVDEISVAALSGLLADDQHVLDAEVTAVAIPLAQKAAASGVASLDATSLVVQKPASVLGVSGLLADDQHVLDAEVTAVAIPLAQKAAASGVASLDATSLVVQNPANAVSTATASKVVIRDAAARAAFAAPAAAGDALIKGTRVTAAELLDGTLGYFLRAGGAGVDPAYAALAGLPTIVRKTANETVNNSNALQNDDHLLFAVAANEIWEFIIQIHFLSTAVANIKYAFTVPAAGAIGGGVLWSLTTPGDLYDLTTARSWSGQDAVAKLVRIYGRYVGGANAGNVQFQWAQNTAEATNSIVYINSCIIAHKLG